MFKKHGGLNDLFKLLEKMGNKGEVVVDVCKSEECECFACKTCAKITKDADEEAKQHYEKRKDEIHKAFDEKFETVEDAYRCKFKFESELEEAIRELRWLILDLTSKKIGLMTALEKINGGQKDD